MTKYMLIQGPLGCALREGSLEDSMNPKLNLSYTDFDNSISNHIGMHFSHGTPPN